jgi:hypothetical protein
MDKPSVQDAFMINGFTDKQFNWNEEGTVVTITNKKNIAAFETYTWTLGTAAKSEDGFPLAKEVSARWTSDAETRKPEIAEVCTVIKKELSFGTEWQKTGILGEKGAGHGEAIKITFTKSMDASGMKSAVRFEPSLSGSVEVLNSRNIIFIPDRDPLIETYYVMTVSGEVKDKQGITMGEDYRVPFLPDIKYLHPVVIDVLSQDVSNKGAVDVILENTESEIQLSIDFDQRFSSENQIDCINRLKLSRLFPSDAPTPALISARWSYAKTLDMIWSLSPGVSAAGRLYYKCVIPGGQNGITNGDGAYLKEDIVFYVNVMFRQ